MESFDAICRTCNTERSNLISLSSNVSGSDSLNLIDVLATVCPSLPIEEDDILPHKICYFCSKQLEIAYKFQLQCKKSYDDLWRVLAVPIKEDPDQPTSSEFPQNEQNEGGQDSYEVDDARSYLEDPEEEFEDTLNVMAENLEYLDDDEDMDANNYADEEPSEETPPEAVVVEENLNPLKSTEHEVHSQDDEAHIVCCHCDRKFLTANGLLLHEKLAHKNLKHVLENAKVLTISCKYCLQVFERKGELLRHCQTEHVNELASELTCSTCQKKFTDNYKFERHLMYHSEYRYQCLVKDCKREFIIKYKLTDHMKRFHGINLTNSEFKNLKGCVIRK